MKDPLKQILVRTRSYWDQPHTRPAVRQTFLKALQCRTPDLGAEVYRSEDQGLVLYHTCKSRACPSCGYRAMIQWLRQRWAALPENIYKGIAFTMPDLLWPLFHDNPHLAKALPALAAKVIQTRVTARWVQVGVIAIVQRADEIQFTRPHDDYRRWPGSLGLAVPRLLRSVSNQKGMEGGRS
jgi:hypothetical protein